MTVKGFRKALIAQGITPFTPSQKTLETKPSTIKLLINRGNRHDGPSTLREGDAMPHQWLARPKLSWV